MIDPQLRDEGPPPVNNRLLRQFAVLWILALAAIGYWWGFARENTTFGWTCVALAFVPGLAGLALPAIIRPVFVVLTAVTLPIGWLLSFVILGILYFGIFTPVALVFRLLGRDALTRRFRPDLDTYFVPKPAPADLYSYFRQS
jgi:hypothetical protein